MMAYFAAAMLQVQFTRVPSLFTFWAIAGADVGRHHWSVRR